VKKIRQDNLVYVDDVLSAIAKINRFCKNASKDDFMKNELLMDAVVRNLEIIGEASSKLTDSFRKKHIEIGWRKIMRGYNSKIKDLSPQPRFLFVSLCYAFIVVTSTRRCLLRASLTIPSIF
jgi:uncharacterized protein with HEPN domain